MISRNAVAVAWALHARGLSPTAWKVLMVLAHRVNNKRGDWDVWPRQKVLAEDCEVSLPTLKRHLIELEEKGFLARQKRFKASGGYSGCTYTLRVRAVFDMPAGTTTYSFADEDPDDDDDGSTIAQSELSRSLNGELSRSLTAELSIEPLNIEPLNREPSPLTPSGSGSADADLFGSQVLSEEDRKAQAFDALVDSIGDRWKALAESNKLIAMPRKIDDARRALILKRTEEHVDAHTVASEVWEAIFAAILDSRFLRGLTKPGGDREEPWAVSFDWMLKRANFKKIIERNFRDKRADHDAFDPTTGRKLVAHDVARNRINERLSSSRERVDARRDQGTTEGRRLGYSSPGPR